MGKHYVWNVSPGPLTVRLKPRGLVLVESAFGARPRNQAIADQYREPDAQPMVFDLTAQGVAYLTSRPAGQQMPILKMPMLFYKAFGAPDDQKWGYGLRLEQNGSPVSGIFSDGSELKLDREGYHLLGMRGFDEGYTFAAYRIVMELRAGGVQ